MGGDRSVQRPKLWARVVIGAGLSLIETRRKPCLRESGGFASNFV